MFFLFLFPFKRAVYSGMVEVGGVSAASVRAGPASHFPVCGSEWVLPGLGQFPSWSWPLLGGPSPSFGPILCQTFPFKKRGERMEVKKIKEYCPTGAKVQKIKEKSPRGAKKW